MKRPILWTLAVLLAALLIALLQPDEPEPAVEALVPEPMAAEAAPSKPVQLREPVLVETDDSPRLALGETEEIEPAPEQENPVDPYPDPIQTGDCTLILELVDAETREHIEGTVQLWRLGAPGNEHWLAGDQLQAKLEVPSGGIDVPELPAGRYRVRCEEEAGCVEDPEPIVVGGARTRVLIPIHRPKSFPIYLRVHDQDGRRIENAETYLMEVGRSSKTPDNPPWRERRLPNGRSAGFSGGGSTSGSSRHAPWKPARAGPDGFLLGELRQDDRRQRIRWRAGLRVPGRKELRLEPVADMNAPVHLISVLIDPDVVLDHLLMPDGSSARSLGFRVEIEPDTLQVDETLPAKPWLAVPIRVELPNYYAWEPFEFTFTLLDLPLPDRFLVAKKK